MGSTANNMYVALLVLGILASLMSGSLLPLVPVGLTAYAVLHVARWFGE